MATATTLRILRQKYDIRLRELAERCGVSNQYISQVELGQEYVTPRQELLIAEALLTLADEREHGARELRSDVLEHRHELLTRFEEDCNGTGES